VTTGTGLMLAVCSSGSSMHKIEEAWPWVLGINDPLDVMSNSFKFECSWQLKFCFSCAGLWMLEASLSIIC
jgi:hypothetical protein